MEQDTLACYPSTTIHLAFCLPTAGRLPALCTCRSPCFAIHPAPPTAAGHKLRADTIAEHPQLCELYLVFHLYAQHVARLALQQSCTLQHHKQFASTRGCKDGAVLACSCVCARVCVACVRSVCARVKRCTHSHSPPYHFVHINLHVCACVKCVLMDCCTHAHSPPYCSVYCIVVSQHAFTTRE
jgi:hypothetical protein